MADGRALTARYQTTDDLPLTLQASHGRIGFRVAFVILPGSDDVMTIISKTLRESLDIDIVQAFHQRVSQIGELFAAPDSAVRADETVSSVRRLSGPGLTLKGMLQAQAENTLPRALTDGDWTPERVEAWDNSREMLMNAVELSFRRPDDCRVLMFPDGSDLFWGCCMTQVPKEELVAGLSFQRVPYLLWDGSNIFCDHRNLVYIFSRNRLA